MVKPIPGVKEGPAIPWFGQPGKGMQYELPPGGIDQLIKDGFIVKVEPGGGGVTPKVDGGGTPHVEGDAPKVEEPEVNAPKSDELETKVNSDGAEDLKSLENLLESAKPFNRVKAGQQGFGSGDGPAAFADLTKNATALPNGRFQLSDGTIVGSHTSKFSSEFTIDINQGGKIFKIRFAK